MTSKVEICQEYYNLHGAKKPAVVCSKWWIVKAPVQQIIVSTIHIPASNQKSNRKYMHAQITVDKKMNSYFAVC
jgi:uncharacterized iron-regulated protein